MKSVRNILVALVLCILCTSAGYWIGISKPHYLDDCPVAIGSMIMDAGGNMSRALSVLSLLDSGELDRAKSNLTSFLSTNAMIAQGLIDEHPNILERKTVLPICEKAKQYLQNNLEKNSQQDN